MTRYNIILLLAAMIGSGVLGGAANFLLLHKDDPVYAKRSRSFVLGLVAALLAPLFLKTISSEMVDKLSTIRFGEGVPFDFFVFIGFCLLTAMFSRTFAETVAKRLATEVEKASRESEEAQLRAMAAEEKAREVEPVLRQVMEERTEPLPASARAAIPLSLQDLPVDTKDRKLLRALSSGSYCYRTVGSLADEVAMADADTVRRLEKMREQSLAGKKTTDARSLWFLTDRGSNWLEAQDSGENSQRDQPVM